MLHCIIVVLVSRSLYFSFDDSKKSMSNDSLNKAMEHPVNFDASQAQPTSSEVTVRQRERRRERRFSAPPSDRRIRDSVGSLDYLSESQGSYSSCCNICYFASLQLILMMKSQFSQK